MRFTVSELASDDDVLVSCKQVKLGSDGTKKFMTPLKPTTQQIRNISPVHEAYRTVQLQTLKNCCNNSAVCEDYSKKLNALRDPSALNILTLGCSKIDCKLTDDMIKMMSDLQYLNSDVIVLPSWFDIINNEHGDKAKKYIELTDKFYEYAMFLNNKPVIASIPVCIPDYNRSKILGHLIDKNICSFMLDYNGRTLLHSIWTRQFMRDLNDYKIEKEGIVYSMNAFQGAVKKNEPTYEAHDFLAFTSGMDIVGGKHIAKGSSKKYESAEVVPSFVRLFDRDTYRYSKQECASAYKNSFETKCCADQIDELNSVHDHLLGGDSIADVLKNKRLSDNTLNTILETKRVANENAKRTKLDDFF